MEYLVFALFAFGLVIVIMVSGFWQEKKNEKRFIKKLRTEYGILPKREYKPEQYANISHYFLKHKTDIHIDDITWNDLEMDEIFKQMNHTYSAAGEEYLYYTLRTLQINEKKLCKNERIIEYFSNNEEDRVTWQFMFAKLGRTGKFSIYDYLKHLEDLGTRSNLRHYLAIGAFAASIASLFLSITMGIIFMVGVLIYNLITYFKIKNEIEPYITSFSYIFRLIHFVEKAEKNSLPVLKEEIKEMCECKKALNRFRRGSYLLMSPARMSASNNPLELVIDYLRMGFHLDLIQFNRMLSEVRGHIGQVDRILAIAGFIETQIAIGAFRKGVKHTLPEFVDDRSIAAQNLYHPLIADPIKNSMEVCNSVLLTGSNASGKSTFLKTVAINAILAQTIHTCLADRYRSGIFRICSSMCLRDDVRGGDSYYMVEIKSLKRMLDIQQDKGIGDGRKVPVLCFVDEVLRGTNTVERIAASTQILRSLNGPDNLCFAATHDIELTHLLENEYENYHFEEVFAEGDIFFPYKIMYGRATTRNAIKLLSVMGYDSHLIEDAEKLAENFMKDGKWTA